MNAANGSTIKATLSTVTLETVPDTLWDALPDLVSGKEWRAEFCDAATTLADWLDDSQEYDLDDLDEMSYKLADSECEDYYSNINKRVQELSLWASSDLDEEVRELQQGRQGLTLTDLNTLYLYCAMRGLYYTLAKWALDEIEVAN